MEVDIRVLDGVKRRNRARLISTYFNRDVVRPNVSWTGSSNNWYNTTSPFFRAMTGDIPLKPDLFEVLAYDYNTQEVTITGNEGNLEEEIIRKFSGLICDLTDDSDVLGWTKEHLRQEIVKSPDNLTLGHLGVKGPLANDYPPGLDIPRYRILDGQRIERHTDRFPKYYYQTLYRKCYNTSKFDMNGAVNYSMFADFEWEMLEAQRVEVGSLFTLTQLSDRILVDDILRENNIDPSNNPRVNLLNVCIILGYQQRMYKRDRKATKGNKPFQSLVRYNELGEQSVPHYLVESGRFMTDDNRFSLIQFIINRFGMEPLTDEAREFIEGYSEVFDDLPFVTGNLVQEPYSNGSGEQPRLRGEREPKEIILDLIRSGKYQSAVELVNENKWDRYVDTEVLREAYTRPRAFGDESDENISVLIEDNDINLKVHRATLELMKERGDDTKEIEDVIALLEEDLQPSLLEESPKDRLRYLVATTNDFFDLDTTIRRGNLDKYVDPELLYVVYLKYADQLRADTEEGVGMASSILGYEDLHLDVRKGAIELLKERQAPADIIAAAEEDLDAVTPTGDFAKEREVLDLIIANNDFYDFSGGVFARGLRPYVTSEVLYRAYMKYADQMKDKLSQISSIADNGDIDNYRTIHELLLQRFKYGNALQEIVEAVQSIVDSLPVDVNIHQLINTVDNFYELSRLIEERNLRRYIDPEVMYRIYTKYADQMRNGDDDLTYISSVIGSDDPARYIEIERETLELLRQRRAPQDIIEAVQAGIDATTGIAAESGENIDIIELMNFTDDFYVFEDIVHKRGLQKYITPEVLYSAYVKYADQMRQPDTDGLTYISAINNSIEVERGALALLRQRNASQDIIEAAEFNITQMDDTGGDLDVGALNQLHLISQQTGSDEYCVDMMVEMNGKKVIRSEIESLIDSKNKCALNAMELRSYDELTPDLIVELAQLGVNVGGVLRRNMGNRASAERSLELLQDALNIGRTQSLGELTNSDGREYDSVVAMVESRSYDSLRAIAPGDIGYFFGPSLTHRLYRVSIDDVERFVPSEYFRASLYEEGLVINERFTRHLNNLYGALKFAAGGDTRVIEAISRDLILLASNFVGGREDFEELIRAGNYAALDEIRYSDLSIFDGRLLYEMFLVFDQQRDPEQGITQGSGPKLLDYFKRQVKGEEAVERLKSLFNEASKVASNNNNHQVEASFLAFISNLDTALEETREETRLELAAQLSQDTLGTSGIVQSTWRPPQETSHPFQGVTPATEILNSYDNDPSLVSVYRTVLDKTYLMNGEQIDDISREIIRLRNIYPDVIQQSMDRAKWFWNGYSLIPRTGGIVSIAQMKSIFGNTNLTPDEMYILYRTVKTPSGLYILLDNPAAGLTQIDNKIRIERRASAPPLPAITSDQMLANVEENIRTNLRSSSNEYIQLVNRMSTSYGSPSPIANVTL